MLRPFEHKKPCDLFQEISTASDKKAYGGEKWFEVVGGVYLGLGDWQVPVVILAALVLALVLAPVGLGENGYLMLMEFRIFVVDILANPLKTGFHRQLNDWLKSIHSLECMIIDHPRGIYCLDADALSLVDEAFHQPNVSFEEILLDRLERRDLPEWPSQFNCFRKRGARILFVCTAHSRTSWQPWGSSARGYTSPYTSLRWWRETRELQTLHGTKFCSPCQLGHSRDLEEHWYAARHQFDHEYHRSS